MAKLEKAVVAAAAKKALEKEVAKTAKAGKQVVRKSEKVDKVFAKPTKKPAAKKPEEHNTDSYMNPEFVAILQKLLAEQGRETLLSTAKCKAFLSDYTRNEYKKESRFLLQALDAGVQKAIDTTENITICKLQQVRLLHEEYGLDEKVATEVVDTLALVLRGDTGRTEIPKEEPRPKEVKRKPQTVPKNQGKKSNQKESSKLFHNSQPQKKGGIESVTGLANKLAWLQTNAQSNGSYVIDLNADESIRPQTLSYSGRSGVTIALRGLGAIRTISLSSNGSLFTVESGVTLILDSNVSLRGHSDNNASLVSIKKGGTLIMNTGASISCNTKRNPNYGDKEDYAGGVCVYGSFEMRGGEITSNTLDGVDVRGRFKMTGGEVSGNSRYGVHVNGSFTMAAGEITGNSRGVFVSTGSFTMTGGKISGIGGKTSGGVAVFGNFTMRGGEISGNSEEGVGVWGSFTMAGGEISGNSRGGVRVHGGSFTMANGKISSNINDYSGGGVEVNEGCFTMSGGQISSNTAKSYGGGVYVRAEYYNRLGELKKGGTFTKTGGTIYGSNESDTNRNRAINRGHAVYVDLGSIASRRRDKTAGPGDMLDSEKAGKAGGWGIFG